MRADMVAGLRAWRDNATRRRQQVGEVRHDGWRVEQWRDPLGVVGFVFEGRPNVFADATGVLRTGNTVVFRIGSDALGTARAIMAHAVAPALRAAGLPDGAVQLVDSAAHAAGLGAVRRHAAVAGRRPRLGRGRRPARRRRPPARCAGQPARHRWRVAGRGRQRRRGRSSRAVVRHSLDRKVCNTLNVCCIVRSRAARPGARVLDAAADGRGRAGSRRRSSTSSTPDDPRLATEWEWDTVPEVALRRRRRRRRRRSQQCNRFSPHFVASLISDDPAEHDAFYRTVDAPFVGNGFTRWVDGQFALVQPELGLSNWQAGRLFGRGGVLSGDSVHTVRLRAIVDDHDLHR